MATIGTWLLEQWQWIQSLDRPFVFLLTLPFLVALSGVASGLFARERHHR
jgi:hypothetical protein